MPADDLDDGKMPLLEHLVELRKRLLYSFIGMIVAFILCYSVAGHIYNFLVQPLADATAGQAGRRMIFTALHEAFFTQIKVAFFAAMCVSFPIMAAQVWGFISPGLYKDEKKAFLPFLVATPVLFTLGASMVYYLVIPLAWRFFLSFETPGGDGDLPMELEPKVDQYLSLVMRLIFAFGICFELPVLIILLSKVGIVSVAGLKAKRKYAVLIAFVVAAILTPPDVISQILLAVPVIILYEISILCAQVIEKQRGDPQPDEDEEDAEPV
jgi:sec-independent protein translocase protein TatC